MQVQISQINNGFLVAVPPGKLEQQAALQMGQQPQPVIKFASNFEETVSFLREAWPMQAVPDPSTIVKG